jgi:hypothetical protein
MGINVFQVVPFEIDKVTANMVEYFENKLNERFGKNGLNEFDWCARFKGDDGALLSIDTALAFSEDASPYLLLCVDDTYLVSEDGGYVDYAVWQGYLNKMNKNYTVIFYKARM